MNPWEEYRVHADGEIGNEECVATGLTLQQAIDMCVGAEAFQKGYTVYTAVECLVDGLHPMKHGW